MIGERATSFALTQSIFVSYSVGVRRSWHDICTCHECPIPRSPDTYPSYVALGHQSAPSSLLSMPPILYTTMRWSNAAMDNKALISFCPGNWPLSVLIPHLLHCKTSVLICTNTLYWIILIKNVREQLAGHCQMSPLILPHQTVPIPPSNCVDKQKQFDLASPLT